MRKLYCILGLTCFLALSSTAQNYQVTVQSNYKSGQAYLVYHMGATSFTVEDSALVGKTGLIVFKEKRRLPGGIYAVVFPGRKFTPDFFVGSEQVLSIKADSNKLDQMVVTGSKENVLFKQYQAYVEVKGKQLADERDAYLKSTTKADSALHEANYSKYNTELNSYRENLIKTQPTSMMAVLLKAMKEPPYPTKVPVTRQDSVDNYNYYKAHYWDGVTFMDERVIRTPFFLPKLERYYREVIGQSPADSIIKDIDYKLLLARNSPEMYKLLLNWLTDEYLNPKYMGQDAIFVHLFEKYHSKGLTNWLNDKQMETISRRAYMQMANLIGEKAANLEMLNTQDKTTPLYEVDADYTVVVFWDPTCGHCKQELPRIDSMYRANWQAKKVKIYAVLTENEKPLWLKYIAENNLTDWVNVYQTKEMAAADAAAQKPGFRQLFDVTMTPTIYLLDKEKRIIGKKLNLEQMNDLLDVKFKNAQAKN